MNLSRSHRPMERPLQGLLQLDLVLVAAIVVALTLGAWAVVMWVARLHAVLAAGA